MNLIKQVIFFVTIIIGSAVTSHAQVEIIGGERAQSMINDRIAGLDTTQLTGYRIQIFFGSNRNDAQAQQSKFNYMYPDMSNESYVLYYDPNWRVRVGNFYRKIDAQPLMVTLQRDFGNVFLIRDKIELPSLR